MLLCGVLSIFLVIGVRVRVLVRGGVVLDNSFVVLGVCSRRCVLVVVHSRRVLLLRCYSLIIVIGLGIRLLGGVRGVVLVVLGLFCRHVRSIVLFL